MKRTFSIAVGLVLLAATCTASAASPQAQAPGPVDRALCAVGLRSHCLENATSTNPAIINKRTVCPALRCTDNATINNPVIINR